MKRFLRHLQFWLLLFACLWLSLAPQPPQAFSLASDKVWHLLAYFVLYLSGSLAYRGRLRATTFLALLFGFSLFIEIFQHFIPGREFSLGDLVANFAGLALGALAVLIAGKVNRPS